MNTFIWSVIAEKQRPLKVRSISGLTCTLASTILLHSSRAQTKEKPSLPPLILVRTGIRNSAAHFPQPHFVCVKHYLLHLLATS